jgi:hypothetical protein
MTYVKRKRFTRKPKDILKLSLKRLWPGDGLLCTKRTFEAISSRVSAFNYSWRDRRIVTLPDDESENVMIIRRTA